MKRTFGLRPTIKKVYPSNKGYTFFVPSYKMAGRPAQVCFVPAQLPDMASSSIWLKTSLI